VKAEAICKGILLVSTVLSALTLVGCLTSALQISQIEFDLHLPAGNVGQYSFSVLNNETRAQNVKVYKNDWLRTSTGVNDFLPLNGARWLFPRAFHAGEEFQITYLVKLPAFKVTVSGNYLVASPSARGEIVGETLLFPPRVGEPAQSTTDGTIRIIREIVGASPEGDSATVQLAVRILEDVVGLRIDEVFSSHIGIEALDSAGGTFDTVARSNGDWLEVEPTRFRLDVGEAQDVSFSIRVSQGASGTYWGMIFVEGVPPPEEREGATVLAIERFGVKVYETVPGTEVLSGEIQRVRKLDDALLSFEIAFVNSGNVQLKPRGQVEITDQTGDIIQTLSVDEFYVLPGAVRYENVVGQANSLPPGRYVALAVLDIGNPDYLVAGQLVFEVVELALVPIGGSASSPRDLDGDGTYEDINGDGLLSLEDPALLGFYIDSKAVQENAEAFDFNDDGVVDFNDVVALKAMLEGQ